MTSSAILRSIAEVLVTRVSQSRIRLTYRGRARPTIKDPEVLHRPRKSSLSLASFEWLLAIVAVQERQVSRPQVLAK